MPKLKRFRALVPFLGLVGSLLATTLCAEPAFDDDSKPLALVGGRIITQTDAGTVEGTILIEGGKIVAIGSDVAIPDNAEQIDVAGTTITPGLIDARSALWLTSSARRDGANDGRLDVLDGVDPYADDWKDAARQGITAVSVQPSASGLFSGKTAVLRVAPAGSVDGIVLKADAAVQAALGISGPSANSIQRYTQFENVKRVLDGVKRYKEDWEKYEKAKKEYDEAQAKDKDEDEAKEDADEEPAENKAESEDRRASASVDDEGEDSKPEDAKDDDPKKAPEPPKRDPLKEFLLGVLKGEIPLRVEAHREDDLKNAFALAKEFYAKLILEGVSDPRSAREEIVKGRIPMVLGPIVELESTPSYRRDRPQDWPASLLAEDSRWALGTFGQNPAATALLRVQAAAAVANGIDPETVLNALTKGAAEILGVADSLGSIAEGRAADLAVFVGDPLDPSTPACLVISQGEIVHRADVKVEPSPERIAEKPSLPNRLPKRFVVRTERLLNASGRFEPGQFRVVDGTITDLGPEVSSSDDELVLELGDAVVTPGLITAHTDLGLGRFIDEQADADASYLRAVDVFDPEARSVRDLLRGGVLAAAFAPGSSNVAAGAVGAVRLGALSPLLSAEVGQKFVLTSGSRNVERFPASLGGQVQLVESVLTGSNPDSILFLPVSVQRQLQAERQRHIQAVLSGDQVAFFQVSTRAETDAALRIIDQFELQRAVLVGPQEIEAFQADIERLGVGLVPRSIRVEEIPRWLSAFVEAAQGDVPVAFGGRDPWELRLTAALAVREGLPRELALRALTIDAARLAGLPESVGQLDVDQPADFVIWNGSPLDLGAAPIQMIVDGRCLNK